MLVDCHCHLSFPDFSSELETSLFSLGFHPHYAQEFNKEVIKNMQI
ncbi:MAG: hypothetical protein J7K37_02580 [Candidatus Omnitrophica bacterium]|nr:hypothetical protein [Candidatus Omnitrophota bacterium]